MQMNQRIKVHHAGSIGAGDESMVSACSHFRKTHRLPRVVDAISRAEKSTSQGAKVPHAHPVGPVMKAWPSDSPTTCPVSLMPRAMVSPPKVPRSVAVLLLRSMRYEGETTCAEALV